MKKTVKLVQVESATYEFDKEDVINALMNHFDIAVPLGQTPQLLLRADSDADSVFTAILAVHYPEMSVLMPPDECHICYAKYTLSPTRRDPGIYVCTNCKTKFIGNEETRSFLVELSPNYA